MSKDSRLKVLIVVNDLKVAGVQKLVVDFLRYADRTHFAFELAVLRRFGDATEYLYDEVPHDIPLHQFHFSGMYDLKSWWSFMQMVHRITPDVVWSHLFFSNSVTRICAPFFGYKVITVEHNTYTDKPQWHQWVDHLLAPLSSRIVAVSETVASFTSTQEGIRRNKFTIIHGAVDVPRLKERASRLDPMQIRRELGIKPGEHVIVNVARIAPQKNHTLLVDGFALFARAHPEYRLLVGGTGSELEALREQAAHTTCPDRIQFLGYQEDVARLLVIADFFVLTSHIEGFGSVNVEAFACGLPVLTTKTAGPDFMIEEGVNGFFIDAYTPQAVAEGMERMLKIDRAAMREAALRTADQYSIARAVDAYQSLFREVAGKGKGR
jgi:glycosyltransferase involved in cell wall biosynthesis